MSSSAVSPEGSAWIDRRHYHFNSSRLLLDSGRMHYVDEGRGEPILFIHGSPTWSFMWRYQIEELCGVARCIAPDLMGFGLSDKPKSFHYCAFDQSRAIDQLIRHLDLRDITLVAHDYGGPIGIGCVMDEPERFKRIVLTNTWLWDLATDPDGQRLAKAASGPLGKLHYSEGYLVSKQIKSQILARDHWNESVERSYAGPLHDKDDRFGIFEMARCLPQSGPWFSELWSCRESLREKPMMLLWGLKDSYFGQKALDRLWHEFPLAEVHTYENAGHYLMEEEPLDVASHIRSFLHVSAPGTSA